MMAEDITDCTPDARAGWNLAVRTAVGILKREAKVGFPCPEYSVSPAECAMARLHFSAATDRIQSMLDDDCDKS